jgi:hypothetical protein
MKPIKFEEINTVFAKNQPKYLPLPAYKTIDGTVISCWKLNLKERLKLLFKGTIWLKMLTFNKPLQPHALSISCPLKVRKAWPDPPVS